MIERDFERAKRKADWKRVVRFLTGKPSLLLPFDLVRRQVVVKSVSYEGVHEIELDRVIGSVNRYHEFDREFLPKRYGSADRWSRVRQVFDTDAGFPPIKVYQIGEAYFVVDGNHRVSVARQLGMRSIEADVTKFQPNVPIGKDTDLASLIIKKEYSDFLEQTHLDRLRPGQRIEFTLPGRYDDLIEHIAKRRYFLGLETGREIAYEDAVVSWYDGLYRPLVEIFRQEHLLERFPGRTEADLYVWVTRHLYFLRERMGDDVGLVEATRDFAAVRDRTRLRGRLRTLVRRIPGLCRLGPSANDSSLHRLDRRLREMQRKGILSAATYAVPACWSDPSDDEGRVVELNPLAFWQQGVERILAHEPVDCIRGTHGEWSRWAVVYNLFVRATCAFDHDGDGTVRELNRNGLRETGTFVKAIALLPYIQSLGCNVVHLLPVTRIGTDGRKGTLGSPYASANPYQLDETLSEPLLQLGPNIEFQAFVEAAHRLGMRVVLEFVFRTAAKDSEWIARHPEWFYWVRADRLAADTAESGRYRPPRFSTDALAEMKANIARGDFDGLPPPEASYRAQFAHPPAKDTIRRVRGAYVGQTMTDVPVGIPGAFSDWPPDDTQPPWGDVTYLRLYDHEDFNYMAYNTIRMYDERLARPENEVAGLWERIVGILPHYQDRYSIDGAMIDMGHALPAALKARLIAGARGTSPSFALWDEDFEVRDAARAEGYNAVAGNLWWLLHRPERLRETLRAFERTGLALPIFATPETHNTPRCAARSGGIARSRCLWTLGAFLPAIPYLHSGFDVGERVPVNTGLDFSREDAAAYPESVLPLYNAVSYDWRSSGDLRSALRTVARLRRRAEDLVVDPSPETFKVLTSDCETCIAYARVQNSDAWVVIGNLGPNPVNGAISGVPFDADDVIDELSGARFSIRHGTLDVHLAPWQAVVLAPTRPDSAARKS